MSNLTKADLELMRAAMIKHQVPPLVVKGWLQALRMRWRDWRAGIRGSRWRPGDAYYVLTAIHPRTHVLVARRLKLDDTTSLY